MALSQSLLFVLKVSKKGQPAAAEEGVETRLVKEYWDMVRVAIPLDERCRESCKLRRDGDETASGVPRGMGPTTGLNHLVFAGHEFQQGPARKLYYDNRIVWKQLLDPGILSEVFCGRVAPFALMPFLVRRYIAIND